MQSRNNQFVLFAWVSFGIAKRELHEVKETRQIRFEHLTLWNTSLVCVSTSEEKKNRFGVESLSVVFSSSAGISAQPEQFWHTCPVTVWITIAYCGWRLCSHSTGRAKTWVPAPAQFPAQQGRRPLAVRKRRLRLGLQRRVSRIPCPPLHRALSQSNGDTVWAWCIPAPGYHRASSTPNNARSVDSAPNNARSEFSLVLFCLLITLGIETTMKMQMSTCTFNLANRRFCWVKSRWSTKIVWTCCSAWRIRWRLTFTNLGFGHGFDSPFFLLSNVWTVVIFQFPGPIGFEEMGYHPPGIAEHDTSRDLTLSRVFAADEFLGVR